MSKPQKLIKAFQNTATMFVAVFMLSHIGVTVLEALLIEFSALDTSPVTEIEKLVISAGSTSLALLTIGVINLLRRDRD